MRKINVRPLLIIFLFAIAGVLSAQYASVYGKTVLYISAAVGISAFTAYFLFNLKKKEKLFACLALLAVCFAAFFLFAEYYEGKVKRYSSGKEYNETVSVSGRVNSVIPYETYGVYVLDDVRVNGSKIDGKVRLTVKTAFPEYDAGERLSFDGKLEKYEKYMYGRLSAGRILNNVKYRVTVGSADVTVDKNKKLNLFEKVRYSIYDTLKNNMNGETFPVAYAMIVGDDAFLDASTSSAFRYSGIAHIFAVSGLHIGLVASFLGFVFRKIRAHEYISTPIIIAALIFYAGVCGFSPSSVRALVMCATGLVLDAFGERMDFLNNVTIAALIILSINPVYLFGASFVLSFACVYAIAVIYSPLKYALHKKLKMKKKKANALAVSVAAFVGTTPVMLYFFKGATLISVLTNLIFLPVMSTVYVFTFAMTLLSRITTLGNVCLYLPDLALLGVTRFLRALDFSGFMVYAIEFGVFVALYYAVFTLYSGFVNVSEGTVRRIAGALIICLTIGVATLNVANYVSVSVTVRANYDDGCIAVVNSEDGCLAVMTSRYNESYKTAITAMAVESGAKDVDCFIAVGYTPTKSEITEIKKQLKCKKVYATLTYDNFDKLNDDTIGEKQTTIFGFSVKTAGEKGDNVIIEKNGSVVAVCGSLAEFTTFNLQTDDIDLLVCSRDADLFDKANEPQLTITCGNDTAYSSAKRNGELKYFLKNGAVRNVYKLQNCG